MNIVEYMKLCALKKNGTSLRQVAMKAEISPQNLSYKAKHDSFYLKDIERIAAALGAHLEVKFIDDSTGGAII